jgi:hypothetical protein
MSMNCDFKNCKFCFNGECMDEFERMLCPYMNNIKCLSAIHQTLENAYQVIGELIER